MKLGLISDSHDEINQLNKAVNFFNSEKIDFLLHCGDFIAPFVARALKDLDEDIKNGHFYAVFGNNDHEIFGLMKSLENICEFKGHEAILELSGKKIYFTHELNPIIIKSLAKSNEFDIIVIGHTHQAKIEKIGSTLVVNPGEACGWLYGKATIMIVDLDTMDAQIIEL